MFSSVNGRRSMLGEDGVLVDTFSSRWLVDLEIKPYTDSPSLILSVSAFSIKVTTANYTKCHNQHSQNMSTMLVSMYATSPVNRLCGRNL
mgnify:CR=1 FL=1